MVDFYVNALRFETYGPFNIMHDKQWLIMFFRVRVRIRVLLWLRISIRVRFRVRVCIQFLFYVPCIPLFIYIVLKYRTSQITK